MPIRFTCHHCQQRLSVGSRKAGQEVHCPNCRRALVVPHTAPTALPSSEAGPAAGAEEDLGEGGFLPLEVPADYQPPFEEFAVYDDPRGTQGADRESEVPVNPHALAVPRWIIYCQGVILLVVGLGGLALGYQLGRSVAVSDSPDVPQPFELRGRVTYRVGGGDPQADDGSVVLAVPAERTPERTARIPIDFLPPEQPPPAPNERSLLALQNLGGRYARTDPQGNYTLQLPDVGRYHLLVLSRNARRGDDADLAKQDLAQIGTYFEDALVLLGEAKYRWQTGRLVADSRIDFEL